MISDPSVLTAVSVSHVPLAAFVLYIIVQQATLTSCVRFCC